MISTEAVFITTAIEAHENRKVACFDIPGAFLHADCKEGVIFMLLGGQLAELVVLLDPKLYRKYVRYFPTGQAMLYVHMTKALHGILKSALWFYKKFSEQIWRRRGSRLTLTICVLPTRWLTVSK